MARNGRAGAALATAAVGSFVAGTIATVVVTLFAPFVADFAVKFGPPEYFLLMLLAFMTVSVVLGMTALFIGLAIGCVGLDQISGQGRYTGGIPELLDGIEIVLVAVGLFAVAEVLYAALYEGRVAEAQNRLSRVYMSARLAALVSRLAARRCHRHALGLHSGRRHRDTDLPELRRRAQARARRRSPRRIRRHRRDRRRGRPRGGQHASVTAALIPLLTLGIPTSNTTAILIGAFQNYGIQPGTQLFTTSAALVWALIASLYIGNAMLLVLNLPLAGVWVRLLKIPKPQIYAGILIFATVGPRRW
jgi:putative tricarboxylic transport membrane protein